MFWGVFICCGFAITGGIYVFARKAGLMAVADLIWTAGLGIGAVAFYIAHAIESPRGAVVLALVVVWSGRLSAHLLRDRVLPGREDPRYEALERHWGGRSGRNFFFLFLMQVPFVALFLLPVAIAMGNTAPVWAWSDWVGLAIAVIALAGESIADRQLAGFRARAENRGAVCRTGLWAYSRHPNYFFEWLHWWAYVAFAWGADGALLALIGPLAMYVFLRFLTGIPPAERSSLRSRGEAYRQYQKTTNAFFPWKPRQPNRAEA